MSSDTLMDRKNRASSASGDIARLMGTRFAAVSEIEDGRQLSESLVKSITGGDGYGGELYIDVAIDKNDDNFFKLSEWFLRDEGKPRYENAWLFHLPLEVALLNSSKAERGEMSSVS